MASNFIYIYSENNIMSYKNLIVNTFNGHFVNVGKMIANSNVPPNYTDGVDNIIDINTKSMFIKETVPL